jgi:HD-GYP domain-containing protein (c-di-GMP phosphodiesterase class II)
MFNISDILKKYKETKNKTQPQEQEKKEAEAQKESRIEDNINISSFIGQEAATVNNTKAKEIYDEALLKAKEIYRPDLEEKLNFNLNLNTLIEKIVNSTNTGNKELLKLCLVDYSNFEDYLYGHVVNVCIISVDLGLGLGFEPSRLNELGTAGFLHDIGEIKYLDLIDKTSRLTEDEYRRVKEHPQKSVDILSRFSKELSIKIIDAVRQEHERIDGSGYPYGLKDEQINEYAKIIGLVDVYEAMMHQRTYRSKYTSLETIKNILNNKTAFEGRLIKILIERIGIFPAGTFVRLNTREIASVIKDNPKSPLRPVVNIIIDASGKKSDEPKQVDLAKNSVIYIEECLKDSI